MTVLQKELGDENLRLAEIQKEQKMLAEEVDDEDIARIVGKWTGIPVSRMMEGKGRNWYIWRSGYLSGSWDKARRYDWFQMR